MDELPLEYCALRFLLQWDRVERTMCARFRQGITTKDLRRALKHFQVARNFKGLKSEPIASSIIAELDTVSSSKETPETQVVRLAEAFKRRFRQFNLSAASKLLWLKHQKGIIIYDSRAVAALGDMGRSFSKRDYRAYCSCWRQQFESRRRDLRAAAKRLPEANGFLPARCRGTALESLARKKWFVERVFDMYLWESGAEG